MPRRLPLKLLRGAALDIDCFASSARMNHSHFFNWLRSALSALIRRPPSTAPATATAAAAAAEPSIDTDRGPLTSRSLEELRADLARLRASSKERHAAVSVPKLDAFDESVFADFRAPSASPPSVNRQDDYPRTVYVPRSTPKAKPTR